MLARFWINETSIQGERMTVMDVSRRNNGSGVVATAGRLTKLVQMEKRLPSVVVARVCGYWIMFPIQLVHQ